MRRNRSRRVGSKKNSDQLPKVFIGTSYSKEILKPLRKVFNEIPFQVAFAKDYHRNLHLIEICDKLMYWADYSIFDLSGWNPNVALELGMAEGLNEDYFIILNTNRSEGVPSDIKGIQRLEFKSYTIAKNRIINQSGLWYELLNKIGRQNTVIEKLWRRFENTNTGNMQRYYACRILCKFRGQNRIALADLPKLWRGLGLNEAARSKTVSILKSRNLIEANSRSIHQKRKLFPPDYR